MLAYSSCCNDSILLGPFLGLPFYFFSQWPTIGTVLFPFVHGLLCPFVFFLWASTAHLLILLGFLGPFANSTLPWALLLTSLGFPGPITLSLSLGFMGLPSIPYFLSLHYLGPAATLSHFANSYSAHEMLFLSFLASLSPFTFSRPKYTLLG